MEQCWKPTTRGCQAHVRTGDVPSRQEQYEEWLTGSICREFAEGCTQGLRQSTHEPRRPCVPILRSVGREAVQQSCAAGAFQVRLAAASRMVRRVPRGVATTVTVVMAECCVAFPVLSASPVAAGVIPFFPREVRGPPPEARPFPMPSQR
jgi:hypothetical protein